MIIAGSKTNLTAAILTLLLAVVPAVLWPGSVSWMNDEPDLIINACLFNRDHALADRGLFGSFLVPYGPLPTQFYQFLLLFTHDLHIVVMARAFVCSSVLALSLLWLARSLRLTPWFAAAVVLSPYLWLCMHGMWWDASFTLPIGMLALAAYAAFLRNGSPTALTTAAIAAALVPLVHPQALPLFIALAGHALWKYRPALRRSRWRLIVALVILVILHAGYVLWAVGCVIAHATTLATTSHFGKASLLTSVTSPLLGGRLLTAIDFLRVPQPEGGSNPFTAALSDGIYDLRGPEKLTRAANFVSLAAIPLVWIGIIVGVIGHARRWFGRRHAIVSEHVSQSCSGSPMMLVAAEAATPAEGGDINVKRAPGQRDSLRCPGAAARSSIAGIALTSLALQMGLDAFMRVPAWPQYCFGTFAIFVLFAWIGVEFLRRIRLGLPIVAVLALALGYITFNSAWQLHHFGWERGKMSPSLSNQIEVARKLNDYSDRMVWTTVPLYQQYPRAMGALRLLYPPDPLLKPAPGHHELLIRYKQGADPQGSEIELVPLGSEAERPRGATMVEVAPIEYLQP